MRSLAVLLLGGCAIEQTFRPEDFACAAGGLCFDAGMKDTGPRDSGVRPDSGIRPDSGVMMDATPFPDAAMDTGVLMDAGEMDAAPMDAAECAFATPLPAAGIVSNDTSMAATSFLGGGCFPGPSSPDITYDLLLPGRARELRFDVTSPDFSFEPALHAYRNSCDPMDRIGCAGTNPNTFDSSTLAVANVDPGYYAVVVDGQNGTAGMFTLLVSATMVGGEPCDPARPWIGCDIGACTDMGGGDYRCPAVLDCADGIDGDGDGTVDEDTCTTPPVVTCSTDTSSVVLSTIDLFASATDDSAVIDRRWSLDQRPFFSAAELQNQTTDTNLITTDRIGTYRITYRAVDDALQASACGITTTSTPAGELQMEMFWTDGDSVDLDAVVIHPAATSWFGTLACSFGCNRDWGAPGALNNPSYRGDAPASGRVESIHLLTPEAGRYGIGVHAFQGPVPSAYVDVYCRGQLAQTFGPKAIINSFFWKVADVEMNPTGCDVFVLDDVVPDADAQSQR